MSENAEDSGRRDTSDLGTELGRSKAETVHSARASGGALNKIISGLQKSESMEDQDDFPKKKGSFQIMSVKSRGGSGEHGLDGEVDSIDEMDESKTDDILSDKVDFDLNDTETEKATDVEPVRVTHTSSNKRPTDTAEDADMYRYIKSVTDVQSRFKVVKIQTKQPYKRGRWSCYDYLDPNLEKEKADVKPEERAEVVCSDSSSTGGGSSLLHYMVSSDDGATKETQISQNTVNASAATHKAAIQENIVTDPYIAKIDTSVHGSSSLVVGYRKAPTHLEASGKTPIVDKHTDVQSSDTTRILDCAKNEMPYTEEVVDNQLRPNSALSYANSAPENVDTTLVSVLPDSGEKEFLSNQIEQQDTGAVSCGGPSQITSTTSVVAGAGHRVDLSDIQKTDPEPASPTPSELEKKRLHPAVAKIKGDTNSALLLEAAVSGIDQGTGTASTGAINVLPGNNTSDIQAEIQISGVPRNVVQADALTSKPSDPSIGVTSIDTPETQGALRNISIESRGLTEGLASSRQISLINSTLGPPLMELVAATSGPLSPNGEGYGLSEREQSDAVAIDNKIEQAMDLVKSHLMFAVREEVEVLKEQINELIVKNQHLEKENSFLKSAATPETLSKLQDQEMPPTAPTSISNPPQNNMSSSVNSS